MGRHSRSKSRSRSPKRRYRYSDSDSRSPSRHKSKRRTSRSRSRSKSRRDNRDHHRRYNNAENTTDRYRHDDRGGGQRKMDSNKIADKLSPQRKATDDKNKERWPNDKFFEMDDRAGGSSSNRGESSMRERRGLGYHKPKKSQEEEVMDSRRLQREAFGETGVAYIWGKSPARPEE